MQEQVQMDTDFPERIYVIANESQVGEPLKACRWAIPRWKLIVVLLWVLVYSFLLVLSIHQYSFDKGQADQPPCLSCPASLQQQLNQDYSDALIHDITDIVDEALQIVIVLILVPLVLHYWRKRPAYLCSEGLLVITKKRTESLRWDEIDEVYWKKPEDVVLHKADAEKAWHLKYFDKNQEIVKVVEREVSPRLFEQALTQYKKLDFAGFGCLSVSKEGIVNNSPAISWSMDERIVHWENLENIRFLDGVLSIKLKGEWKRWDGGPRAQKRLASTIPNPMVYVSLAKYLLENSLVEEKRRGE